MDQIHEASMLNVLPLNHLFKFTFVTYVIVFNFLPNDFNVTGVQVVLHISV